MTLENFKQFLKDPLMKRYLKVGLFSIEIYDYLEIDEKGKRDSFRDHLNKKLFSEDPKEVAILLGKRHFQIIFGSGRMKSGRRKRDPSKQYWSRGMVYFNHRNAGATRVLLEMKDSDIPSFRLQIYDVLGEVGPSTAESLTKKIGRSPSKIYGELSTLTKDRILILNEDGKYRLSLMLQNAYTAEIQEIWKEIWGWKPRRHLY